MTVRDLDGKNVCILGFGREGRATFEILRTYAPNAHLAIADMNPKLTAEVGAKLITGPDYLDHLDKFDIIIKTPGLPWRPPVELVARVTSATELFLDSLPQDVTVVGITGTKGKSTTAHLIHTALVAGGQRAVLAGNIGEPMLTHLPDAQAGTVFVLELSSYQLETLHTSPPIAVITSIFPDHLDYHGSFDAYVAAKRHITQFQHKSGVVFYNDASADCRELAAASPGHKVPFTHRDFPGQPAAAFDSPEGRSDLAAAYLVATHLGVPAGVAEQALTSATGLPHRQEDLGTYHGITWIDDSAATTPQSTLAALNAFKGRVDTIIVGGLDRGYVFSELGERLAASDIRNLILFPDTGARIRAAVEAAHPASSKNYFTTSDMAQAVSLALKHTRDGCICLLSSGSPSYNLFKNYGERGDAFRAAVRQLTKV
jgi:UDP-N-acetylmuramoyl-L-alanine---L-glutamate ligase